MASRVKGTTMVGRVWTFAADDHTVHVDGDRRLVCSCLPAWTATPTARCLHIDAIVDKYEVAYEIRNFDTVPFVVIVSALAVPKLPTPAPTVVPAPPITTPLPDYIEPMYAKPLPPGFTVGDDELVAEQKYDGQRETIRVVQGVSAQAWSRPQRGQPALRRPLAAHMELILKQFPTGFYDGEECSTVGGKCYDVRRKGNESRKFVVIFDILHLGDYSLLTKTRRERRAMLEEIFKKFPGWAVQLAQQWPVQTNEDVTRLAHEMWDNGKEGLIIKRQNGVYQPGQRSNDWIKIKKKESGLFTIVGYKRRVKEIVFVLSDNLGKTDITVRIPTDDLKARVHANPDAFIGREVRCDFTERTSKGNYREIVFDRFENE